MAMRRINIFQNCGSMVEDAHNPETKELEGRVFVIIDNDTGEIWRYAMPVDVAKIQGQKLMGIGGLELADGRALSKLERPPGKG